MERGLKSFCAYRWTVSFDPSDHMYGVAHHAQSIILKDGRKWLTYSLAVGGLHHKILAVVSHRTTQAGEFVSAHRGYRITFSHQTPDVHRRLQALYWQHAWLKQACSASSGGDRLATRTSCVLLSLCYTLWNLKTRGHELQPEQEPEYSHHLPGPQAVWDKEQTANTVNNRRRTASAGRSAAGNTVAWSPWLPHLVILSTRIAVWKWNSISVDKLLFRPKQAVCVTGLTLGTACRRSGL